MALNTNLNTPKYLDDYDQTKDYYRILFQPGVSVQVRELNQLQSMFQKQLERFGDNIFASGTIVSGCNFTFLNPYPYIKIKDLDFDGKITVPFSYVNLNVKNETTGVIGWVTNFADGFEASDPNLKTLYINYQNYGSDGNTAVFSAGDLLKVYDPVLNGVESIVITNGGIGFSNTDKLLAISSVAVTITSGTIANGDFIINNQGANVQVVGIDTTTLLSSNQTILTLKPRSTDLANAAANSSNWTLSLAQAITNPANTLAATVQQIIGAGFSGTITTDGVGTIQRTNILNKGSNYTSVPFMTVRSIGNATGYSTLNLQARNFVAKIFVATTPSAVGNGYGFTVSEGVVYQKGFFLRVVPQTIVVGKYTDSPDNVAVGFITNEQIVTSDIDPSLLDNASNRTDIQVLNSQAPGADRLKLTPQLMLTDAASAAANAEFLTIAEWKEGRPFKQNQLTIYSTIGDEMARRTEDASGDFVIDPFLITTRSPIVSTNEGEFFNIVIDPGKAYIDGYRVETTANFNVDDEKGTATLVQNNHIISLNYGNYVVCNNFAGTFQFNTGDSVDLYDTARGFLTTPSLVVAQTLLPSGTKIGTANIRSSLLDSNEAGTPTGLRRLYLFNIQMNSGRNFRDVRSIYYNGTNKGVADVALSTDITTGANIALLQEPAQDRLTFDTGIDTLKNANAVIYFYRTIDQTVTSSNGTAANATLVKDISGTPNEFYPYTGSANLSSTQMLDLYVVPTSGEMVANNAATGTVTANTAMSNVIGAATTFLTDFAVGDWVYVTANATGGSDLHRVTSVVNNTFLTIDANNAFVNTTAKLFRAFPQNVPIPFGQRSGLNANVNVNQNILTLDFGFPFSFSGTRTCSLAVNIQRTNPTQLTKTPNRNKFVIFCTSNNAGGSAGPWCMGVPDVFRLRGVYVGNSSVSNTGSNQIKNFYVDHNQNPNFLDLSWLTLINQPSVTLGANDYILVQFDYFTGSGVGFYDTVSYTQSSNQAQIFLQDSQPLSNLTSVVNSFEIPEIFTDNGLEIDLMNQIDFRPYAANTVAPAGTVGSAPLNPGNTTTLSTTGEKKFPLPDSSFFSTIEYYLGRSDAVFVDKTTQFIVSEGPASQFKEKQIRPTTPPSALRIVDLVIPPYPNLPTYYSTALNEIINTRVMNQKFLTTRINRKTITTPVANNVLPYLQPKVYTMADIGNIDRRLKDVEYISALNALESGLSHTFIPSSVDPTLDRFKFGFFVDDFTTSQFSDLTNPQYWALKEGTDIGPPKMTWDVGLPQGSADYIDSTVISFDLATVGSIDDPVGLGPICALNLANTVAYQKLFRNAQDIFKNGNPANPNIDVVNVTLADQTVITETINYLDTPLNEWLQNHHYDAYKNFDIVSSLTLDQLIQSYTSFLVQRGDSPDAIQVEVAAAAQQWSPLFQNFNLVQGGSLSDLNALVNIINGILNFDVSGSTTGHVTTATNQDINSFITNLLNNLKVTPSSKPTGGTFVNTVYQPPAVLYFYNYDEPSLIQIYQNNILIKDSSSASNLDTQDINLLIGPGASQWFNDEPQFFLKNFVDAGGGFVTFAGKIPFNYDPSRGTNFTIKVQSSPNVPAFQRWRYVFAYPINGASAGCVPPTQVFTSSPNFIANYTNVSLISWCGNGNQMPGSVQVLTGFTEIWSPINPPTPQTSIQPFDISADWYGIGV